MSGIMILLVLLTPPQDPKKEDTEAEKARRAAIVDRIMAQQRVVMPQLPPVPARPAVMIPGAQQNMKRIMLELREVAPPADGEAGLQPVAIARPINISEFALSKENFDRWVFDDPRSEEGRKNHLGHLLIEKVHTVERDGALEPDQLRKLRLAGNGDIKRFLDRVEAARTEFETVRQDYNAGRLALGRLEPLAAEYQAGPFGSESVFEKTLRKIRGEEKAAASPGK